MERKIICAPLIIFFITIHCLKSEAQCGAGYNQVTLNWDYLDYFAYTGNYVAGNPGYYLSGVSDVTTQNFAFGTNRLTIALSADISGGENGTHTGDIAGYGGEDVQYTPTATGQTITLTFEQPVVNPNFTLYDIDANAQFTVTAADASSSPLTVNAVPQATTILTIGILPLSRTIAANNTALANNDNKGTATVTAVGTVKTITITVNTLGTDAVFWLSRIIGCSPGNFPTNYYTVSKPFTGMPGYVLHALDGDVYAVNPVNGVTKRMFSDPGGNINSMAYDPYNRILYYVYSLTANPGTNKAIKKYDFNTETISTVLADITTIGVPVVTATGGVSTRGTGVESGGAAFYDGSYYIGIETGNKNASGNPLGTSSREAVIWRIDFNGSNVPYRTSQVFALPVDNGSGTVLHDWSDFTIYNGILYDFDGAGTTTQTDIYHFNLLTSATVNYHLPSGFTPGQPTVDWNGNIYQLHAINPGTNAYVALYNPGAGTIGTRYNLTSTPPFTPAIPSLGDAAEGFRPLVDYGDAPASYDPVSGDPAVHELDSTLNLGTAPARVDREWVSRGQTALANSDNYDDGVGTVTIFNPLLSTYVVSVSVYNHTGASATVRGWLDYNGNGVFDVGEASALVTVPSSTAIQSINLSWTGISSSLASGTYTYLRIRTATASLSTSNSVGYFSNGEVEDYRVVVDNIALSVKLLDFNANVVNKDIVSLTWSATLEENFRGYQLERSSDGSEWKAIGFLVGNGNSSRGMNSYHFNDQQPVKGRSYYRLKLMNLDGNNQYSPVRSVEINDLINAITVLPNPAKDKASLAINTNIKSEGSIRLINVSGESVLLQFVKLEPGNNIISINKIDLLPGGTYIVQLVTGGQIFSKKLFISK